MTNFMVLLPWIALLVSALYEDSVHRHDRDITHSRTAIIISAAVLIVVLIGYALGKNAV